jgi:glutamate dehydrogenase/leucine dehydrogenase
VPIRKLQTTDAFVSFDLEGADRAVGVVRLAPKILVDGAALLARSQTYEFASFELTIGGASAGINTKPDGRDEAVKAFVAEVGDWVADGSLCLDAAKGLSVADLEPLAAGDPRADLARSATADLTAVSLVAGARAAIGDLDGRRVAIEGVDALGSVAVAAVERFSNLGARVTSLSTAMGTAVVPDGFAAGVLADALAEHGPALVTELSDEPGKPWEAIGAEVDVLLVGSKAGVLTHDNAGHVKAAVIVPAGRVPVTAKALAALRGAGIVVLPDFITLAGPGLIAWTEPEITDVTDASQRIEAAVGAVLAEVLGHDDGPLLAGCYRAETFLRTWRDALPFGRPLA